uniref:Uncharacterized protein n=1 Tax=Haemonchus contortus TaxID=6289 RepID=W6NQR1_HAECO
MTPSVSNTYYASLEAPPLTTEMPEDNDVLPETVTDSVKREDVRKPRRKGPACSFDLNPMEDLWGIIVRKIHANNRPFQKIEELKQAVLESWYRQTGILSPASSPEQRRTRRKKNESPAGTDTHEYKPEIKHEYTHAAEYVTHDFRVHYAGAGATQHPAEMAAMQHYTMIPEHMLAQEYPQPVLL